MTATVQPAPMELRRLMIANDTREILRRAALLADIVGAEMHVVNAYPDLGPTAPWS